MSKYKIGEIVSNEALSKTNSDYYKVDFFVSEICEKTLPGQFVHVKIANLRDRILRRPFSIANVTDEILTVVYKVVGEGTEALSKLKAGSVCDLMGPLGNPFSLPKEDEVPVVIGGGYGSAATYILANRSKNKGFLLLGARTKEDLILYEKFEKLGVSVHLSTNDGTVGTKGFVTDLIPSILENNKDKKLRFYACGPHPMLMAVGKLLLDNDLDGELSLDHLMCCGVGACFACVVKIKADNEDGWRYARTCNEGPIFKASSVYYE